MLEERGEWRSDVQRTIRGRFTSSGERLLLGSQTALYALDLADNRITPLQIPSLSGENAIVNLAANPVSNQIAFATTQLDIYLSNDGGQNWRQIVRQGVGRV